MNSTVLKLIVLSIIALELVGCLTLSSMHDQFTEMNVGCHRDSIQISNERYQLNGIETWTAVCNGKTYDCDYNPEGNSSHCYLRDE